ncbi:MAG: transketolase C-terminal domain-containing protein, partial [Polaromonas sp.]|nr:transketolase C-terminal domain-containing protein [Polaromonas sp.]
PNCKAYDPAFACELAVIIDQGVREMMVEQQDVFYYVTLMNENYAQPDLRPGAEADILRGCYQFSSYSRTLDKGQSPKRLERITLMGSGAILTEVIKAAEQLAAQGIEATVFSVTSWSELARDAAACQQRALAGEAATETFIAQQLNSSEGPIIAATDYVRAVPESIRAFLPPERSYLTLGTDGFGRSDTRAALRGFFGVDAASIVKAARHQLASQ